MATRLVLRCSLHHLGHSHSGDKRVLFAISAGTTQQREPRVRVIYEVAEAAVEAADWEGCSIIAVVPQMCFQ